MIYGERLLRVRAVRKKKPGPKTRPTVGSADSALCLKVVADPNTELRLAERGTAAALREDDVLPLFIPQRPPRPVEVNWEPEHERLEADAVGRPAVLQPEATDRPVLVDRDQTAASIQDEATERILLIVDDHRIRLGVVRPVRERLVVEPAGAAIREEHAAHAADHAERRERCFDDRETELGVGEDRVLPDELQVVIPPHFGVASEIHVIGEVADALEAADPERQHTAAGEPLVVARVAVERLA